MPRRVVLKHWICVASAFALMLLPLALMARASSMAGHRVRFQRSRRQVSIGLRHSTGESVAYVAAPSVRHKAMRRPARGKLAGRPADRLASGLDSPSPPPALDRDRVTVVRTAAPRPLRC